MLVFEERGKPEYPEKNLSEKNLSEQSRESGVVVSGAVIGAGDPKRALILLLGLSL